MKHYIAMSGMRGCLPDYCQSHQTEEGAVSDLASLHDWRDGGRAERLLSRAHYVDATSLRIEGCDPADHLIGADYVEISLCNCNNPHVHNDCD